MPLVRVAEVGCEDAAALTLLTWPALLLRSVPAITCYYGAFQDSKHIYIVMEYCARGDLLERLLHEGRAFSEVRARAPSPGCIL